MAAYDNVQLQIVRDDSTRGTASARYATRRAALAVAISQMQPQGGAGGDQPPTGLFFHLRRKVDPFSHADRRIGPSPTILLLGLLLI